MTGSDLKLLGVVLCGGKSRRMGRDKASLKTPAGTSFLDLAVHRLTQCCDSVCLSASIHRDNTLELITDPEPSHGPISGVVASLDHAIQSGFDACVVTPIDTPNLRVDDLQQLIKSFCSDPKITYAFDRDDPENIQPLIAIYPVESAALLAECIDQQQYSLRRLLMQADSVGVPLSSESCQNINTPTDLDQLTDTP